MRFQPIVVLVLLGIALTIVPTALAEEKDGPERKPAVEVMFVLDTTGSMANLLEGAKTKIWKIVNQIVSGKPVPSVRVGLVAYRDRGDEYVTRTMDLTDDLDKVYAVLRRLSADGGGNRPESVNQALAEAVNDTSWSRSPRTLRIIFLVGDAPPRMDFPRDVKYPVTCEKAARAGIIINTIQCGNGADTKPVWIRIAKLAEGRYAQIAQSGGMVAVKTPFDGRLGELSRKLSATAVFYGSVEHRKKAKRDLEEAEEEADAAPDEAKADRAGYVAKSGRVARLDLLEKLGSEGLAIEKIDRKLLPAALRKMNDEELAKYLEELLAERKKLRAALIDLDRKRAEYLKKEAEKKGGKGDAFDDSVLKTLREQAKRIRVDY